MSKSEVVAFHASASEAVRLQFGIAQLEAARTRTVLSNSLPPAPATVLDVGGGAGAHAFGSQTTVTRFT